MIFMLLEVGDEQLRILQECDGISPLSGLSLRKYETVKENNHFKKGHILVHQDQVNAVMMAIKPGFLSIYCQKYTKNMVLDYLWRIRETDVINQDNEKQVA